MKREEIREAVKEVVLDVVENMYFMFPEVVAEDQPVPSFTEPCFRAEVILKNGPELFTLHGFEKLVEDMAKNLLGVEDAIAEADLIDVFKEAANVIAGNLITRLSLDSSVGIDVPVAERVRDCSELRPVSGALEVIFDFEGRFLKVAVKT